MKKFITVLIILIITILLVGASYIIQTKKSNKQVSNTTSLISKIAGSLEMHYPLTDTHGANVWWINNPILSGLAINVTPDNSGVLNFAINQNTHYKYGRTPQELSTLSEIATATKSIDRLMNSYGFIEQANQAYTSRPSTALGSFSVAWYNPSSKIRCRLDVNDTNIELSEPSLRTMPYSGVLACISDQEYQNEYNKQNPLIEALAKYYATNGSYIDSIGPIIYVIPSYVDKMNNNPNVRYIEIIDISHGVTNYFTLRNTNGIWVATQGISK